MTTTNQTNETFSDQLLTEMADKLKVSGYKVYYSNWSYSPNEKKTYFHFTDGTRIGYCQVEYFGGLSFSTVHKPCRQCGTGFSANEDRIFEPSVKAAEKAFIIAPSWASQSDRGAVVKYKSWEEYTQKNKSCTYTEY